MSDASEQKRKWPWVVAGVLLGVVLLTAIAAPLLLDVERHRGRIEEQLRKATGWDAELGQIELSVWSGLALTVEPATLKAPGEGSSFRANRVAIHAAWMPLLRGRLEIDSIALQQPDITLVRPDLERGWVLPLPAGAPEERGTGADAASSAVSIGRIEVRQGALRLEDRSVEPARSLAVEQVDIDLRPATGEIRGTGAVAGDGGRIHWNGSPETGLECRFERLGSGVLAPWIGEGLLHPGGQLDGKLALDPAAGISGTFGGESLRVLAGSGPLPSPELTFRLSPEGAGWRADELTLTAGGARIVGRGTLVPLALELELPSTPLEAALELTDATFPLGLDVSPPGSARVRAWVDLPDGGELSYRAEGELTAARFVAAEILPEAKQVRAAFELTRTGELRLRILEASVGGGPLKGEVRIDSIDPLGTLTFDGELTGASLGQLLGGFVDRAAERVAGPSAVRGKITVDLGAPTVDASSIGGGLTLGAEAVSLAGWDLEGAFRESLRDKLGGLAAIASRLDPDALQALEDDDSGDAEASRLLDRLAAEVRFDSLPWPLETVRLQAGGVSADGRGKFDPVAGTVDLRCRAELDAETTRRYVERYSQLKALVDDSGRLRLPLRLRGPLTGPEIDLELDQLAPGLEEPEDAVKGLLRGLIDRERSKKKNR